ncbi:unnamed protein product, partial [Rotaria socialis]
MSTLTFSTTEKHKPLLICKGFAYTISKAANDKTYWKCEHDLGFKTNYEQDPVFAHHVHQIAALAFLQPNDVSQDFDDLYNSLPQMLHPLLDYFEDTYRGVSHTAEPPPQPIFLGHQPSPPPNY